ncbi:MAG: hypothetical protein SF187_12975 [Deltaproteobacteria bacterium]|nr:hypothetical protein [Deltaproteobacteria bacterium]
MGHIYQQRKTAPSQTAKLVPATKWLLSFGFAAAIGVCACDDQTGPGVVDAALDALNRADGGEEIDGRLWLPDGSGVDANADGGPPPDSLGTAIAGAIERLSAETCFRRADVSMCDWGDFEYSPTRFSIAQDTREAILVVDDFSTLPTFAIRYQNRIKAFLRASPSGRFEAVRAVWRVPVALHEVLTRFATAQFISAKSLGSLREPIVNAFGRHGADATGHGSQVLSMLVEANPHHGLVLVDQISLAKLAPTDFCASGDPEATVRLRTLARRVADDLRRVMKELGVHFVNFSAGQTRASVQSDWQRHCSVPLAGTDVLDARLGAYEPIMTSLFGTPGVFAANAAINASDRESFPYDWPAPQYSNRMRAGYFTALASGLDPSGRGTFPVDSAWPARSNVDVYLNSGVLAQRPFPYNDTPLLQVDEYGVDIFPITQTTTSWITPLLLSRFIHARHTQGAGRPMTNELISELRDVIVPPLCPQLDEARCVFQDPLLHGQIEAVRLLPSLYGRATP